MEIGREVTLVLCTPDGDLLGALPPFGVAVQWWQEAGDVVAAARATHGVEVTVLRLLQAAEPERGYGGAVAYLAQVDVPPTIELTPWPGPVVTQDPATADPLADHPLRLPYARPGGPQADLAWADSILAARGMQRTGPPQQQRTWNLSSIWRLPTSAGTAWLKAVPPFFAHEAAIMGKLDPDVVPPVLGGVPGRVLLGDVPGDDLYDATGEPLLRMVRLLVTLQAGWIGRLGELAALGLPDWRSGPYIARAHDVVDRASTPLDGQTRSRLDALVAELPQRFAALADTGVPDTLVHGDFHPGNVRGTGERLVVLDWGDSGIGHPLLDQPAFLGRLSAADRERVDATWSLAWRQAVPGCDPDRAAHLLRPLGELHRATVYLSFLDAIEPSEHPYHAGDPVTWLRLAAQAYTNST